MTDAYYLPFGPDVKLGKPFGVNSVDEWLAPAGEPVRAAGDGVVVFAGSAEELFYAQNFTKNREYTGDVVVVKSDGAIGPFFEYRNVGSLEVKSNERVVGGQVVASAGEQNTEVGALPWRFNLSSRTAGRVNPRLYQTDYWSEAVAEEPEVPTVVTTKVKEPAAPKRRRNNRSAEPVATEALDSPPIDTTPVSDAAVAAKPIDAFPVSDTAPDSAPIDSGISTES